MLHEALTKSLKRVRICRLAATTENLVSQVTLGMRTIHYSGHGRDGFLAFEVGACYDFSTFSYKLSR
jgi:hypothetical protein